MNRLSSWQNSDLVAGLPFVMVGGQVTVPAGVPNSTALSGVELFTQFAADEPLVNSFITTQGGLVHIQ